MTNAHSHSHEKDHDHAHGVVDPTITTSARGIWAVKWSFIGLMVTALLQILVVWYSNSVALLADTIHNLGDATTAIPLWIAFSLARRKPSQRFTYGLGRVEDLAGLAILLTILFSAVVAGYESVNRFLHPLPVEYLWAVALASVIGFAGNEIVAIFRIRVGKEINSAALIADGYHARVDGLTSLGVLASAIGVWLGFPLADPIIGVVISITILRIVWDSGKAVFTRMLDGADPELVAEMKHVLSHTQGVEEVSDVRVRWQGHRLDAEINLAASSEIPLATAHEITVEARHRLMHAFPFLKHVTIHVDPASASGEEHHQIQEHAHDGIPTHSHS